MVKIKLFCKCCKTGAERLVFPVTADICSNFYEVMIFFLILKIFMDIFVTVFLSLVSVTK